MEGHSFPMKGRCDGCVLIRTWYVGRVDESAYVLRVGGDSVKHESKGFCLGLF